VSHRLDFPILEVLWRFFKRLNFNFPLWHSKVNCFCTLILYLSFVCIAKLRQHCQQVKFIKCLAAGSVIISHTSGFCSKLYSPHLSMMSPLRYAVVSHFLLHSQPNQCPFLFLPPLISSTAAVMMIRLSSWEYEADTSGWEEVLYLWRGAISRSIPVARSLSAHCCCGQMWVWLHRSHILDKGIRLTRSWSGVLHLFYCTKNNLFSS